jgi:hypothetical protein
VKLTHLFFPIVVLCLIHCACAGELSDLNSALPVFRADEQRSQAIAQFASLGKANEIDAMLSMFVPTARAAEGDKVIRKWLYEEVAPFFAAFNRLHTYKYIEPRTMPDNSTGYRYYTYFINTSGTEVPFDIIVMEIDGKTFVANFNARGCIKGKHPICK